jgi:hypothetical protein
LPALLAVSFLLLARLFAWLAHSLTLKMVELSVYCLRQFLFSILAETINRRNSNIFVFNLKLREMLRFSHQKLNKFLEACEEFKTKNIFRT